MTHSKFISLKKAVQIAILHSKRRKKATKIDLANSLNFISSKEIRSPINLPELDSAGLDGFIISNKKSGKFPISSKIIDGNFLYLAIIDFIASIILDISPPEAASLIFLSFLLPIKCQQFHQIERQKCINYQN